METILVVNAGSSSLKFQVFALGILPDLKCLVKGQRPDSRVALCAIPTDEELMIARHTLSVLSRDAARALVSENVARRRFAS
jgi:acetate kinase